MLEGRTNHEGTMIKVGACVGVSGANGTYSLKDVPAGEQWLLCIHPGFVTHTRQVTVVADQLVTAADVNLPLKRGAAEGQVQLADADDRENCLVEVLMTSHTAMTSPSGAFSIEGIPEGYYQIRVSRQGYQPQLTPIFKIEGDQTTAVVNVTLEPQDAPAGTAGDARGGGGKGDGRAGKRKRPGAGLPDDLPVENVGKYRELETRLKRGEISQDVFDMRVKRLME